MASTEDQTVSDESKDDENSGDILNLKDLSELYTLPLCARFVGGKDAKSLYRRTGVKVDDYICIHTMAVETVTLSYRKDVDSAPRRVTKVPADCDLKFNIVPPKNVDKDNLCMYPTVKDLLEALPTKFQANLRYDDPYLPAIFKPGEVFKLRRRMRCPIDGQDFVECEDEKGTIIQLPLSCRGDFTALEDERSYTIKEIVSFGPVTRKLKLCAETLSLYHPINETNENDENPYCNFSSKDVMFSKITGVPLNFKGLITLHKPEVFAMVSPQDEVEAKWKLDLSLDLLFSVNNGNDYEQPMMKEQLLKNFVSQQEADFPVTATITRYQSVPTSFRKHIQRLEVIIHRIELQTRLLGRSNSNNYIIPRKTPGRLRIALRKFKSVQEIIDNKREIHVKVLEEIASDFPIYLSLNSGDILHFSEFNVISKKVKLSRKNSAVCQVVKCVKYVGKDSVEIDMPTDFEVSCIEVPPPGMENGFPIADAFSGRVDIPITVDYLPVEGSHHHLRTDCEIHLEHIVSDPCVLISPVPSVSQRRKSAFDSKIPVCLRVPLRHKVHLKLREKLNFPPSYFRLPPKHRWLSPNVESVSREEYDFLAKYSDLAYDECETTLNSQLYGTSEKILNSRLDEAEEYGNKKSMFKNSKRKGRTLSLIPSLGLATLDRKTKRNSVSVPMLTKSKSESIINPGYDPSASIGTSTTSGGSDTAVHYDDENIYETYEHPKQKPSRGGLMASFRRMRAKRKTTNS